VIPEDIINKQGFLTAKEKKLIQKHAEAGYRIAEILFLWNIYYLYQIICPLDIGLINDCCHQLLKTFSPPSYCPGLGEFKKHLKLLIKFRALNLKNSR
ncbi:MAG: hypothetical protein M1308_20450, partial [Actinobacteria bacterium]|nr:hypothetical protein [Actinomycetota bacterium]